MSSIAPITSQETAAQCVDLVRRFAWIERAQVPPPEGVEVLVVTFTDGEAGRVESMIFGVDCLASDSKFTHWFPAPRQPECSDYIDDNESPEWPTPGLRMADQIVAASLDNTRALLDQADLCACAAALHLLASRSGTPHIQVGKQRLLARHIRLLIKQQDRSRLRRRLQAERSTR